MRLLGVILIAVFSLEGSDSVGSFRARLEQAAKLVDAKLRENVSFADDARYFLSWMMADLSHPTGKNEHVAPSFRHDVEKAKVLNNLQRFFPRMTYLRGDLLDVAKPLLADYSRGFSMKPNEQPLSSLVSYIACVQLAYGYPRISAQDAREKIAKWDLTGCVPDGELGVDARDWPLWKEIPLVFSRVSSVCDCLSFQFQPLYLFLQTPFEGIPQPFLHFLAEKCIANVGNAKFNFPEECELFLQEYLCGENELRTADDSETKLPNARTLFKELSQKLFPILKNLVQSFDCNPIPTKITPENRSLLVRAAAWWCNLNFLHMMLLVKQKEYGRHAYPAVKALLLQRLAASSKVLLSTAQVLDAFRIAPKVRELFQYDRQLAMFSMSSPYEHKLLRDVEQMALLNNQFLDRSHVNCLHVAAAIEEVLLACDEVVLVASPEKAKRIIINSLKNYSAEAAAPSVQATGRLKIALKMLSSALRPSASGWFVFSAQEPDVARWKEEGRKKLEDVFITHAESSMRLSRDEIHTRTNQAVNAIIPLISQGSSFPRGELFKGIDAGVCKVKVQ